MPESAPHNPSGEVFGYPADNLSAEAEHIRDNKLCPFRNRVLEPDKVARDTWHMREYVHGCPFL
jgi:hypothetical protein